jgi:hypothetical protein
MLRGRKDKVMVEVTVLISTLEKTTLEAIGEQHFVQIKVQGIHGGCRRSKEKKFVSGKPHLPYFSLPLGHIKMGYPNFFHRRLSTNFFFVQN